jgi:tape measure domain-containing protein
MVMAAAGQMAEFFATFGFKIKQGDIKRIDKQLNYLEARARRMSEESLSNIKVNISRFSFDGNFNARLRKSLQSRIKLSTTGLNIGEVSIKHFDVDKEALLREMRVAIRYAENNLRFRIRSDIIPPRGPAGGLGGGRGGGGHGGLGAGIGAGAAAGNFGRGLIPGLGVAYGVSRLNDINQELVGQKYAAQAVFGSPEKGQEGLAWLRNFSNEVGQDYRQQGQPYIRMIASATNAGMEVGPTQDMYAGISRYGRTMGLGTDDMKGSMRAVEQMLNKQQIYAEELKTQLAEKMPGVISAMAEAVTGEANNTKELFKLMETGNISAMKYLPEFARILEERAMAGGAYEDAIKASTAEQGRFNNVFSDMVKVFSAAGFEEGQQGVFKTMASFFRLTQPLIEAFGEAWAYIGDLVRIPLGLLADLSTGIDELSNYTGVAKGNILALAGIVTLLALPFTRFATGVVIALAALEDLSAYISGRGSVIGDFLEKFRRANPEEYAATVKSLKDAFESVGRVVQSILNGWEQIFALMDSDGFASAGLAVLRAVAREIGATADALMRVMKMAGYKDPNLSEEDRLRGIQERAEKPKSILESGSGILGGLMKKSLTIFGVLDENPQDKKMFGDGLDSEAYRISDLSKPSSSLNPFMMTDEQVKQSHFADSQIMRLGSGDGSGSRREFSTTTINAINITGLPNETSDELMKKLEADLPRILYNSTADKYQGAPD